MTRSIDVIPNPGQLVMTPKIPPTHTSASYGPLEVAYIVPENNYLWVRVVTM